MKPVNDAARWRAEEVHELCRQSLRHEIASRFWGFVAYIASAASTVRHSRGEGTFILLLVLLLKYIESSRKEHYLLHNKETIKIY